MMEDVIPKQIVDVFRRARRVAVLTGAGISAESGVPTFRDAQTGLWANYRPEDLATPEAFRRNPKLVWEWYAWRREMVAKVQPNAGHLALAELEKQFQEFTLITQNVDGLHQRAGSRNVLEVHGNITRTKCFDEHTLVARWAENGEVPPRCPNCGGMLRPDVVWFGESLPAGIFVAATTASRRCEVFVCIGTSALVYPAAALPEEAKQHGAVVIEINPKPTPITDRVDCSLRGPAGTILPQLVELLKPEHRTS